MTLKEYDDQMNILSEQAYRTGDFDPVNDFQFKYMTEFWKNLLAKAETDIEKTSCDILNWLIGKSQSGNVVHSIETEEKANELRDYLLDHEFYSEIMLDAPEVYYDKYAEEWCVDCMFGGFYTPCWDGWFD